MLRMGVFGGNIVLQTDDPSVKSLLEFQYEDRVFNFQLRKMNFQKIKGKIYNQMKLKNGIWFFELGIGFAGYVLNMFKDHMYPEDYAGIMEAVVQTNPRTYTFKELRDYQNDDVLHLLKFRFGLFSCYTGYGKSQIISVLSNYFYTDQGLKVLVLAPSIKARDELVKRIDKMYGIAVSTKLGHGRIQAIITNGLLNKKEFKDDAGKENMRKEFQSFDVVLADEVEYCINPGGEFILDNCSGAQYRFGFSGTADKGSANMISFKGGINKDVAENKDLVRYFGPSLVYRLPLHLEIDLITVKTDSLNDLILDIEDSGNIYQSVMNCIWTDDQICKTIVKLGKKFPMMFIPINNLVEVISNWIDKYFVGVFRTLLISGEGYIYYDLEGNRTKLGLQEACDYIKDGKVDIIPSTSSGYRALDFPGLENIFLIQGAIAGVVLQSIGRVARGSHMNIISLTPAVSRNIPIYSKGEKDRKKMIKEYYKYCKITESTITI